MGFSMAVAIFLSIPKKFFHATDRACTSKSFPRAPWAKNKTAFQKNFFMQRIERVPVNHSPEPLGQKTRQHLQMDKIIGRTAAYNALSRDSL